MFQRDSEFEQGASAEAIHAARLAKIGLLLDVIALMLQMAPRELTPLEGLALRHLAKAHSSGRSIIIVLNAGNWADACIILRAIIEQLFAFLWVVHEPQSIETRIAMVSLKQDWANAQYLDGLASVTDGPDVIRLREAAASYRKEAAQTLEQLAIELGLTERQVRQQATLSVSAKANLAKISPRLSIAFAYYSGFVHSDGNALEHFDKARTEVSSHEAAVQTGGYPLLRDFHDAVLTLAEVICERCERLGNAKVAETLCVQRTWLERVNRLALT